MSTSIKVAVRCRPLNSREIARGAKGLIRMQGNQTILEPPDGNEDPGNAKSHSGRSHSFTFDHSYWSAGDRDDPQYASQQTLFEDMGKDLLNHAFQGYNTCIFAYGQTGSGKSYSMMGYGADRGIIPLTCSALFDRIHELSTDTLSFTVEVSFIEIYNEKVRDLLNPKNKGNLKVREHPSLGPYVEDLSKLGVESFPEMERLMDEGNQARTVAATQMNETSSRSHSVFTVLLTQKKLDRETNMVGEKVSRISLVDLAGSERANSTGATGQRLKEGANINKSLTTLGKVITALAKESSKGDTGKGKKKAPAEFVPYRDSVLTWLLKDSLGGNSKTAMIAAISPADYEETLSTLRYADQAKKIQNKAVVNEGANAKIVRELKEELAMLRARVAGATAESVYDPAVPPELQMVQYMTSIGEVKTVTKAVLQEQLEQSEKLMADVNQTWEQKMEKTLVIQKEREHALEELGIVIEKGNVGVHTPKRMPHLVNLCEDPLMSECLIYQIKPGKTTVGKLDSTEALDIRLSGSNVLPVHCIFESSTDGSVALHAQPGSMTMVNGLRISSDKPKQLKSGYRIILGDIHVFRFNHPEEVRKNRDSKMFAPSSLKSEVLSNGHEESAVPSGTSSPVPDRPPSPTSTNVDWSYARREAVVARLNGTDVDLEKLDDVELNRLFDELTKVRSHRRYGTSMGRPESQASVLDSIGENDDDDDANTTSGSASRPFSGHTWATDDTSLDSALQLGNISSAEMEERLRETTEEMQKELDVQREEYETKLRTLAESASTVESSKAEQARVEAQLQAIQHQLQAQLDEQRQQYENKMQRLAERAARRNASRKGDSEGYDEHEISLLKRVVQQWRSQRRVMMAEAILTHAVLLKEANVFSREFGKKVTYQFTIVDEVGAPISALEGITALAEVEDLSDPALSTQATPFVAVKVLDSKHNCAYVWSLDRLQARVQQMQRLFSLLDRPSYSKHFSLEDPFYNPSTPRYTFIGSARFPLAPLSRKVTLLSSLRIFSPYTGQQVASCTIRLKPLGITSSALDHTPTLTKDLTEGAQYSFELNIDSVKGVENTDFQSMHCQVRLASIIGTSQSTEDVLASPSVSLDDADGIRLRLRKTITATITTEVLQYMREGHATIEFYGECNPAYLFKCEKWDETREGKVPIRPWQISRTDSDLPDDTTGRRAETELLTHQIYDVKAMISIEELSASGAYKPIQLSSSSPLDPGVFSCRQGLQRRLSLKLSHGCGRQWLWKNIANVKAGNVRLLDPRGHLLDSNSLATVPLTTKRRAEVEYNADGTALITFVAGWDSSAHNSPFLNRITAAGHRVLVEISWDLEVQGCSDPIPFSVDIGLTMQERDARGPSRFLGLFTTQKAATQAVSTFQVKLSPAITNRASELWRLNTASTFVRGEELLGAWKPRGVTLVDDYHHYKRIDKHLQDVITTRALLAAIPSIRLLPRNPGENNEGRLAHALSLWQKRWGRKEEINLAQIPTWEDVKSATTHAMSPVMSPNPSSSSSEWSSPNMRSPNGASSSPSAFNTSSKPKKARRPRRKPRTMKASVKPVFKAATTAKKGYIYLMQNGTDEEGLPANEWRKVYAILRRPYLSLYKRASEEEELPNVINISTVRVDHSIQLEEVLSRQHAFGIYTPVAALFVAAPTYPDMLAWIDLIDPTWRRNQ